jgi:hypothetical protein
MKPRIRPRRSDAACNHARELAAKLRDFADKLKDKFPPTDYPARAAALVFKLDEGVPVYGNDRE